MLNFIRDSEIYEIGVTSFNVEALPDCWHIVIALEHMFILREFVESPVKLKVCKELALVLLLRCLHDVKIMLSNYLNFASLILSLYFNSAISKD